jgi:hypothetical protein
VSDGRSAPDLGEISLAPARFHAPSAGTGQFGEARAAQGVAWIGDFPHLAAARRFRVSVDPREFFYCARSRFA